MRFTDNQCNTLETAASLSGLNLTHWVLSNLMDDAKRDILESIESSPRLKPGDSALFGDCATMHGGIATA